MGLGSLGPNQLAVLAYLTDDLLNVFVLLGLVANLPTTTDKLFDELSSEETTLLWDFRLQVIESLSFHLEVQNFRLLLVLEAWHKFLRELGQHDLHDLKNDLWVL